MSSDKVKLAAFSPCQSFFVSISDDNRVKIWDVASGSLRQELKERDHLNYKYTSLAWTKASVWAGKKVKRTANSDLGVLALGTTTGAIVVWNLEKGEVAQRLSRDNSESGHAAAVTDIVFTSSGATLYSAATEKHVLEWNVKEGSVHRKFKIGSEGASKLALSKSDDLLAIGSSSIKLFDVASGKKSKKLAAGHATAVTQIVFSECSRYIFSSTSERFINVFDIEADSDEPLYNFSADSSLVSVVGRVQVAKKAKNSQATVAAVTDSGAAFVWQHAMQSSSKPVLPSTKLIDSAIVLAAFAVDDAAAIVVARGSIHKPHFETVVFEKDGALVPQLTLGALDTSSLLLAKKAKVEKDAKTPAHVPTLVERGTTKATNMADATKEDDDTNNEGDDDDDEDEATLQERIEALRNEIEGDDDDDDDDELTTTHKTTSRAKAQASSSSLVTVLEQALQSKDNALLEHCLRVHDVKVIDETCRRLNTTRVFPFLLLLVEKFEKRPTRGATMCQWIKYLMLNHTAYLMTVPDVIDKLSTLYQSLDARVKIFPQLHKLSGRLNLVLGQIAGRSNVEVVDDAPQLVYNEDDDDDNQTADDDQDDQDDEDDNQQGDDDDDEE
ncbi:WD repeat-containing protein 43 [Aphanomyces cochlioides]|nr:WD repeat-containing protein 43 [Aphanomyces cochlioides]